MNFESEQPTKDINLTADQDKALGMLMQMHDIFILKGYAGTGKTFLLKYFIKMAPTRRVIVTAPTHKAVGVADGDSTIHSYLCLKTKWDKDKQYLVQDEICHSIRFGDLVIIDESSMLDVEMVTYILRAQEMYNLKIIFIGDPAQIQPIGENYSQVWSLKVPSFTLTEIVRQARDSNIISLATSVRDETAYKYGVDRFVNDKDVFTGDMKRMRMFYEKCIEKCTYPIIISHKNKRVDALNIWARYLVMGPQEYDFAVGENVYIRSTREEQVHKLEDIVTIVTMTDPYVYDDTAKTKFMVADILARSYRGEEYLTIPYTSADVEKFQYHRDTLVDAAKRNKGKWSAFYSLINNITEVKHIYAMTAHRSQGSTFDNVIINCRDIKNKNIMYTAITRAAIRVFLYR